MSRARSFYERWKVQFTGAWVKCFRLLDGDMPTPCALPRPRTFYQGDAAKVEKSSRNTIITKTGMYSIERETNRDIPCCWRKNIIQSGSDACPFVNC